MTTMIDVPASGATSTDTEAPSRPAPEDWITRLTAAGPVRDAAIAELHELMLRAAHRQVFLMPQAAQLGRARCDEIVHAAADEAAVSVLARLERFEGRSRFTTWAYKFAILQAAVEVRRSAWRSREVDLDSIPTPASAEITPEDHAEASLLATAVQHSIGNHLTPHQRRVLVALLIEHVPIDVLAERLGSSRNALYKTLHDARTRLREDLVAQGLIEENHPKEVNR